MLTIMKYSKYPKDLLKIFSQHLLTAIVVSNLIGPIIYVYWLYGRASNLFLFAWLGLHAAIFIIRYITGKNLHQKPAKYILYTILITSFSGFLWGISIIVFAQYGSLVEYAYLVLFMIMLSAASITTISVIYHAFFGFNTFLLISLIATTAFFSKIIDPTIPTVVLSLFSIFTLANGYKYFKKMQTLVNTKEKVDSFNQTLQKEVQNQTFELSKLNETLEQRVQEEIEKNRKKDDFMKDQARLAQMGEMISMIAHQWRQPLSAVSLIMQDLGDSYEYGDLTKEYLDTSISKGIKLIEHMSTTIDDFRNFYKPDQEKLETIASDVVKSAINLYEPVAKKNDIDIDIKLESQNKIHIYKNEVIQVLLNILKNAGDNFKEKEINNPKINIKTFDQNDTTAIIEICDNGGGILEDIMPKIFDPYFSTKSAKNGTGLGLYMSKNIIQEHHQGTLEAYNKKGGACFKISLVDFP